MPQAPQYQPHQVGPVRPSGERFQAANDGGGMLAAVGKGLQQIGKAGADWADAEDAIQAHYDDTYSRKLALDAKLEIDAVQAEFSNLQGQNAIEGRQAAQERLKAIRDGYMERASNPRMKDYLSQRLDPVWGQATGTVTQLSMKAQTKMDEETSLSEMAVSSEAAAANWLQPEVAREHMAQGLESLSRLSRIKGLTEHQIQVEQRKYVSGIHAATIDTMLSDESEDVEMAHAYFVANQDEMTAKDRISAGKALQGPLQTRQASADFNEIVSGGPSPVAAAGTGGGAPAAPGTRQRPVDNGPVTDNFAAHSKRGSAGLDIAAVAGSSIVPVAEGVVEEVGTGDTGGNFIRIRHADGTLTSYMHMQGRSPFKKGQHVTPSDVLGTVGATGRRVTGPHLHLEVKDANGRQIDPEAYLNGAPPPTGLPTDARNWDKASVIKGIEKRVASGEWSFERGERAKEYARKRMSDDESLLADREADADREASEWVRVRGDKFTDPAQIPRHIWNRLSPDAREAYTKQAESVKKAAEEGGVKANGAAYVLARRLAYISPAQFANQDLGKLVGSVTQAELKTLILEQDKIAEEQKGWSPREGIVSTVNYQSKIDGVKFTDSDEASIYALMNDFLHQRRRDNGGKAISETDKVDAYRYATGKVKTERSFAGIPTGSGERERYKLTDQRETAKRRQTVIDRWRAANNGEIPSEAVIQQLLKALP